MVGLVSARGEIASGMRSCGLGCQPRVPALCPACLEHEGHCRCQWVFPLPHHVAHSPLAVGHGRLAWLAQVQEDFSYGISVEIARQRAAEKVSRPWRRGARAVAVHYCALWRACVLLYTGLRGCRVTARATPAGLQPSQQSRPRKC